MAVALIKQALTAIYFDILLASASGCPQKPGCHATWLSYSAERADRPSAKLAGTTHAPARCTSGQQHPKRFARRSAAERPERPWRCPMRATTLCALIPRVQKAFFAADQASALVSLHVDHVFDRGITCAQHQAGVDIEFSSCSSRHVLESATPAPSKTTPITPTSATQSRHATGKLEMFTVFFLCGQCASRSDKTCL